jgi:large repetitive protein
VRGIAKAALTLAATVTMAGALAAVATGPASATYRPPSIRQVCGGTEESSVCVLPPGQTTVPDSYSAAITVTKTGITGATVTFAVTAGSLPPGLTMPAGSGSSTVISGNPTKAGTYGFNVEATDGGLTSTLAYQITVTVQGLPDQLLCTAAGGSFLIDGACVLPDAVLGLQYAGHLPTSHQAGGTLSIITGALPPGLSLPATFTGSGDTISGTPAQADNGNTYAFTLQGTGDQGQPLYQPYQISVDPNQPLTVVLPTGGPGGSPSPALFPRPVGVAYGQDFFSGGGAAPYSWALTAGQLPPGLTLQTDSCCGPRYANDELAGTPTAAGTYTWTMQVSDYDGQQATQQFSLIIYPPLQVSTTPLPAGTVGVAYSRDLPAQGGAPPYNWYVVNKLPPGLTLGTAAPGTDNVLTGTPTKAGTFSFPMEVEDSQGNTATGTVTVTIDP